MILIPIFLYSVNAAFLFRGVFRAGRRVQRVSTRYNVSIIVVARNEAHHIADCVTSLVSQNYPEDKREILLVIDDSEDDTARIAGMLAAEYNSIKILNNEFPHKWKSRKKAGLEEARKNARGDILLLTDADCRPSADWLAETTKLFDDNVGLVVGLSPLQSNGRRLWDGILKMDSLFAALFSAGGIGWGLATTCTGRNLAVRAEALREIGGYSGLPDTLSGDDDFLLREIMISPKWRVRYNFSPASVVPSYGPEGFRALLRQKRRHISASSSFSSTTKLLFLSYHLANYGCWLALVMLPKWGVAAALPLIVKMIQDYLLIRRLAAKFSLRFSLRSFVLWQFLFPLYHLLAAPDAFFGQPTWEKSGRAKS